MIKAYQAKMLLKGYKSGDYGEWLRVQFLQTKTFKNGVQHIIDNFKGEIDKTSDGLSEDVQEILSKYVGEIKKPKFDDEKEYNVILLTAISANNKLINTTYSSRERNQPLFDSILKNTDNLEQAYKINYSNGRKMSYKSYIEMRIRTDIGHQALDLILESGLGKLFYCNALPDCAGDHLEYQDKVYVLDKYKSEYPQLKTVEWVTNKPVYLVTRPNCRHILTPVKDINDKPEFKMGDSEVKKNYKDLQTQRYNERQIRKYKSIRDQTEAQLEVAKDNPELMEKFVRYDKLTKDWEKTNRELISSNKFLKCMDKREDNKKLAYDLGVDYQRKREYNNSVE